MSAIFEGIIIKQTLQNWHKQGLATNFQPTEIDACILLLDPLQNRNEITFGKEFEKIATVLSQTLEQALLIRYSSVTGYRESQLFKNGEHVATFDTECEAWVELDSQGNQILDKRYMLNELLDNVEYETYRNAIQLGLEAAGLDVQLWKKLRSVLEL